MNKINKKGLLIEDDERGLDRAINAARAQELWQTANIYFHPDITWHIVTSYDEFIKYISENGIPDILGFDHDLGGNSYQLYHKHGGYSKSDINYDEYDEKTGYHCAKWLTEYCQDNKLKLIADIYAHSMNSKGRENIISILNNFKKFQEKYGI